MSASRPNCGSAVLRFLSLLPLITPFPSCRPKRNSCQFLACFPARSRYYLGMAFGPQLSQRLTQSLVLAPQLQQSLALLQAPTLELKALVEQELQQNPVLEESPTQEQDEREKDPDDSETAAETPDPAQPPADLEFDPATEKPSAEPVDDFQAEFDPLAQLDHAC